MTRWIALGCAVALLGLSSPALAGWKLIERDEPVKVARGTLGVTPGERWNRSSSRPIAKGEVWTLDGIELNQLYFVSGLAAGETLFREVDKQERPLPRMSTTMLLTDIPDFYESSSRIALDTSLFEIGTVEPATFAGHRGVRFAFTYQVEDSPVTHKGIVVATLVEGKLQLISFIAPTIHYYDRDLPKAEAIIASATI